MASSAQTFCARRLLAAGAFCLAGAGCTVIAAQPKPDDPVAAPDFAGVAYPEPERAQAGPPQVPPPRSPDQLFPAGAPPSTPVDKDAFAAAIQNAASRDEAQIGLAREYFAMARVLMGAAAARGAPPDGYDPVPLMHLHVELHDALLAMGIRARVLGERWRELADQWEISMTGPYDTTDVAGRLRLMDRLTQCIDADVKSRLDHAKLLTKAKAAGTPEEAIRLDPPPTIQYHRDLKLTARAMECSRLTMRVLRGI